MARHRYALVVLLGLLGSAARAQTSLTPEAGILVLRNGRVIEGQVTRAGDFYVLTKGEGVEMWLRATEVEAFCGSLDEAYDFKRRHLPSDGIQPHLDLADWCLRNNLHARCAQQLALAMQLEPNNAQLLNLENRLKLAALTPTSTADKEPSSTATVSSEQLEKTLRALPKESMEKFSTNIQPILLNRCGANQCHGPNAKSEFRLLRPPAGQVASRRFTQRNLYAALRFLDQSNPEASPLVTLPQRRHGSSLTAVFDKHTQNQLAELIAWSKLTLAAPSATAPATISATQATLSQPAAAITSAEKEKSAAKRPAIEPTSEAKGVRAMRPPFEEPAAPPPATATPKFVPKDRFDPEIFNRHYHGGK